MAFGAMLNAFTIGGLWQEALSPLASSSGSSLRDRRGHHEGIGTIRMSDASRNLEKQGIATQEPDILNFGVRFRTSAKSPNPKR